MEPSGRGRPCTVTLLRSCSGTDHRARAATGDVEQEALGSLATERVRRLIDRLTEDHRAGLMLRIVAGLTVDGVARVVGKKPNSVKALQRRGLATIRKEIAKVASTL